MAENALTKLPLAGQLGVGAAIAALIGGIFVYTWYDPTSAELKQKQDKLASLKQEIAKLEVTAAKLDEFRKEVAALETKLETLKRILPPAKETPDLMKKVQYLAQQANLSINRFEPAAPVKKEFYSEWPINIAVTGSYHNLGLFFDRVSRLSRLVNVGNIRISVMPEQSASRTVNAACTATTFVYDDSAPVKPANK